ncbi:hypothetical protein [Aporhodopirellula aestuarii]|uniref:DUF3592 domain-containing protein n=1 Tax=Aporhodopirellula aestuarii TaxID=2950107 RepID=A0ABT0U939_9BACT|nr:hypothetical protein [Aporhodopirellula aestuarii]MCM2373424.1 hypothetical protein [Aporhodopirellula aestuarii]
MNERSTIRKKHYLALSVGAALVLIGVIVHYQSRRFRIDAMICEVGCFVDDGMVVFQLPLCRHAATEPFVSTLVISHREIPNGDWIPFFGQTAHGHAISPIRGWLDAPAGIPSVIHQIGDFGYWPQDGEYNKQRPGKSVWIFMPIWAVTVVGCGVVIPIVYAPFRWSVRAMGLVTVVFALLFYVVTLKG